MPVYAEKELVNGQKRWYIRAYITDDLGHKKQITRHNKLWIGRDGKENAIYHEILLKKDVIQIYNKSITLSNLMTKYLDSLIEKIDKESLNAKKSRLEHFCCIDKTHQVKTYPNEYVNSITKKIYSNWQIEMKNKKYLKSKNKYQNYSISYLNRIHNEICMMLDYAILENYCKENFARRVGKIGTPKEIKMSKNTKRYEVINYEEYCRLEKCSENDLKYNTFFDLAFSRGPRIGEIRAFRVCDFSYLKKQLMVNHTMSKNNILKEPKTVASKAPIDLDDKLNSKIYKMIEILKKEKNFNDNWYIFGGERPISEHSLRNARDKYFKLANINKHIRIHDFRHSCATWLLSIGIPIQVISNILRHSSIKETMSTYIHLLNSDYINGLNLIEKYKNQDQKQDQK